MNEMLFKEVSQFLDTVPARRMRENMLKTILLLVRYRRKEGLPPYMNDFLSDIRLLFELLDAMEENRRSGADQ